MPLFTRTTASKYGDKTIPTYQKQVVFQAIYLCNRCRQRLRFELSLVLQTDGCLRFHLKPYRDKNPGKNSNDTNKICRKLP
jgi:hypothetical protein